jgi:arylsulfatase A-like enzyme
MSAHRPRHDLGLNSRVPTLATILQEMGYRTACVGKWHLGWGDGMYPLDRGFDYFYGFLASTHYYTRYDPRWGPVYDMRRPVAHPGYLTNVFAEKAVSWLSQTREPYTSFVSARMRRTGLGRRPRISVGRRR